MITKSGGEAWGAGTAAALAAALLCSGGARAQAPNAAGFDLPKSAAERVDLSRLPACGSAGEQEAVVCGRAVGSRYRVPLQPDGFDPNGSIPSVSRERNALLEGGGHGIDSCTPTGGPWGWTGCDLQRIKEWQQQGRKPAAKIDIGVGKGSARQQPKW